MGTRPYYLYGVSVSKHNKKIDWNLVRETNFADFVLIKVSDTETTDPLFLENWINVGILGIPRAGILSFRPAFDVKIQCDYFCQQLKKVGFGEIVPIISIDNSGGLSAKETTENLVAAVDYIKQSTKLSPIVLSSKDFFDTKLEILPEIREYLHGIVYYNPIVSYPEVSPIFKDWVLWQYTANGSVRGISGNVEINRIRTLYKKQIFIAKGNDNGTQDTES